MHRFESLSYLLRLLCLGKLRLSMNGVVVCMLYVMPMSHLLDRTSNLRTALEVSKCTNR